MHPPESDRNIHVGWRILTILNIKLCVTRFEYEEPKMGPNFAGPEWISIDKTPCSVVTKFMIMFVASFKFPTTDDCIREFVFDVRVKCNKCNVFHYMYCFADWIFNVIKRHFKCEQWKQLFEEFIYLYKIFVGSRQKIAIHRHHST